jgi:hypothetical protein
MPTQVDRWLRIHEVFHPTDCSQGSEVALLHALKLPDAYHARGLVPWLTPVRPA